MGYAENLALFFTLVVGIVIVPGVDMAYTLASGLSGGRKAGLAAVAGICVGGIYHSLYSALGVSWLLKAYPLAFNILLLAGAVYIAWIGFSLIRSHITFGDVDTDKDAVPRSLWAIFRQGVITCVLNPKAYLFMLAVYPQFIKPAYGPVLMQALGLGAIISVTQGAIYGTMGVAAGESRVWLKNHPQIIANLSRGAGWVLILVAVLTAVHGWQSL
jgi:threonine/homoserine/homoserine lactone efflux protein